MSPEVTTDRELDAWLAEHLFGGPVRHPEWYWFRSTSPQDGLPDMPSFPGMKPLLADGPNRFSSTGDGMLMVLEAMRGRNFRILIEDQTYLRQWEVSYHRGAVDPYKSPAVSSSLSRAVAEAAKAALSPTEGMQS